MFERFKEGVIEAAKGAEDDLRKHGYRVKNDTICRLPKRIAIEVFVDGGNLMEGLPKVIPFTAEAVKNITKRAILFPYAVRVELVTQSVGVKEDEWRLYGNDAFSSPDDLYTIGHEVWNRDEGFVWRVGY